MGESSADLSPPIACHSSDGWREFRRNNSGPPTKPFSKDHEVVLKQTLSIFFGAGDLRGPVIGAAGTRNFEPDGVAF
jgi:hypothetical protein